MTHLELHLKKYSVTTRKHKRAFLSKNCSDANKITNLVIKHQFKLVYHNFKTFKLYNKNMYIHSDLYYIHIHVHATHLRLLVKSTSLKVVMRNRPLYINEGTTLNIFKKPCVYHVPAMFRLSS